MRDRLRLAVLGLGIAGGRHAQHVVMSSDFEAIDFARQPDATDLQLAEFAASIVEDRVPAPDGRWGLGGPAQSRHPVPYSHG